MLKILKIAGLLLLSSNALAEVTIDADQPTTRVDGSAISGQITYNVSINGIESTVPSLPATIQANTGDQVCLSVVEADGPKIGISEPLCEYVPSVPSKPANIRFQVVFEL